MAKTIGTDIKITIALDALMIVGVITFMIDDF